uniref:Secreted protein n=1 Tax=Prolemur simus TaxID=1328070 RepID=A0A8C9DVT7_PROSS
MCVHRSECMYVCVCVCVCVSTTSCIELPVNVVECYTWRVLVFHQFQEKEPHDIVGLEIMPIPLERPPGKVKCPVSISIFYSCHTNLNKNSTALDRGIFIPLNGGVI